MKRKDAGERNGEARKELRQRQRAQERMQMQMVSVNRKEMNSVHNWITLILVSSRTTVWERFSLFRLFAFTAVFSFLFIYSFYSSSLARIARAI